MDDIGKGPVGLDTCVFIYFIEDKPPYASLVEPLFEAVDQGKVQAAASALTLLEVLVVPYRAGNHALAEEYEAILTRSPGLRLVEPDLSVFRTAAFLRALSGVHTPDALQLATALRAGCGVFLTNDRDMSTPAGPRILQLADYLTA